MPLTRITFFKALPARYSKEDLLSVGVLLCFLLLSSLNITCFSDSHLAGVFISGAFLLAGGVIHLLLKTPCEEVVISISFLMCLFLCIAIWIGVRLVFDFNTSGANQFLTFIFALVLWGMISPVAREVNFPKVFGIAMVGYAVVQSVLVILQMCGVVPNVEKSFPIGGTMGNPNVLSLSLLSAVWFFPVLFFKSFKTRRVVTGSLLLSLVLLVIVFLRCRSVWVAMVIGGVVYFYPLITAWFGRRTWVGRVAIGVGLVFAGSLGCYGLVKIKKDSTIGRLLIWKVSGDLLRDNFVSGVGPGNFSREYHLKQADYFIEGIPTREEVRVAGNVNMAYNEFLQFFVELGVLGFLLLSVLLVFLVICIERGAPPRWKRSLLALVAALCAASLFNYTLLIPTVLFQLVMVLSLAGKGTPFMSITVPWGWLRRMTAVAMVVVGLGTMWLLNIQLTSGRLMACARVRDVAQGERIFRNNVQVLKYHPKALYAYSRLLVKEGRYKSAIIWLNRAARISGYFDIQLLLGQVYLKQDDYPKAEQALLKAHYVVPGLLRPRYALVRCYLKAGRIHEAVDLARETLQMGAKVNNLLAQRILSSLEKIVVKYGEL